MLVLHLFILLGPQEAILPVDLLLDMAKAICLRAAFTGIWRRAVAVPANATVPSPQAEPGATAPVIVSLAPPRWPLHTRTAPQTLGQGCTTAIVRLCGWKATETARHPAASSGRRQTAERCD